METKYITLKKPLGLNGWVEKLSSRPLPVQLKVRNTFLKKLQDPKCNASALASIANRDPAFCFHLFVEANKALAKSGNEIKSLEHLISLLGMARVQSYVEQLPCLRKEKEPGEHQRYLQAQAVSLHAAQQAQIIATTKQHCPPDQMYFSALFYDVVYWALWQNATKYMELYQGFRALGKHKPQMVERIIFGCRFSDIARKLAEIWPIPNYTQQCFQLETRPSPAQLGQLAKLDDDLSPLPIPEDKALLIKLNSAHLTIIASNHLAREADWNWYGSGALYWQKIIATQISRPLPQAMQMTRAAADLMTRRKPIAEAIGPMEKLFCFFDEAKAVQPMDLSPDQEEMVLNSIKSKTKKAKAAKAAKKAPDPGEWSGEDETKDGKNPKPESSDKND